MSKQIKVEFVCLGNICRSPMAEAVFRHMVKERGCSDKIEIDSSGTGDWHIGRPPHEGTRRILDTNRISYEGMVARQFSGQDFDTFDYIVCMDSNNLRDVLAIPGSDKHAKVIRFMDLLPDEKEENVPDPYYTGNFEEVYRLVQAGCAALLDQIEREEL
ncbi:low molecular weight protein-tyrosine-phosphatase [Paenibacillus guangzhouensis]|uniref:low molecular weight protein-tyrosine-phosphatase n=1 Tax=Paenibacillus guangzhouensis TaxID=1473112 RepID=UPI001266BD84|nr:low molecular weight protein-tyrosine-phosphatase [Paenibacillus guangzhouensis]